MADCGHRQSLPRWQRSAYSVLQVSGPPLLVPHHQLLVLSAPLVHSLHLVQPLVSTAMLEPGLQLSELR